MTLRKFYSTYKLISSLCDEYFKQMTNLRDVIYHCRGVKGNHPFVIGKILKAEQSRYPVDPTNEEMSASKTSTEQAYTATVLIPGLSQGR